eukprot:scaffold23476_cov247-Skeletonema_menzelii.AAC.2
MDWYPFARKLVQSVLIPTFICVGKLPSKVRQSLPSNHLKRLHRAPTSYPFETKLKDKQARCSRPMEQSRAMVIEQ